MKINKIFGALMIVASVFGLHSCLLDDDEVFSENASARLSAFNKNARETLTSGNATWLFEMYPESSQKYGGYAFTLVFKQDSVSVRSELFGAQKEVSSLWKMTTDNGPVLSFDTYNEILHMLSTPSSDLYQAYYGEFEWVVENIEQDLIRLRGKKTGNTLYLRRMSEPVEDYLTKVSEVEGSIIMTSLTGSVNGKNVTFIIDSDNRQFDIYSQTDTITVAYTITSNGFRFYKEVDINGVLVSEMSVNMDKTGSTETVNVLATGDVLNAVFPEGWRPYNAYIGSYTLYYYTYRLNGKKYSPDDVASADVEIVENEAGKSYLLKGLSPKSDIVLSYVKSIGSMGLNSQKIGNNGDNSVWLCAWSLSGGGNLSWTTSYGMVSVWDGEEENPMYVFVDNGNWSSNAVDSFILWETTASGSSVGVFTDTSWNFVGALQDSPYGNRLPFFDEAVLIKK